MYSVGPHPALEIGQYKEDLLVFLFDVLFLVFFSFLSYILFLINRPFFLILNDAEIAGIY